MHLGQTFQILFMKELVKHPEKGRKHGANHRTPKWR